MTSIAEFEHEYRSLLLRIARMPQIPREASFLLARRFLQSPEQEQESNEVRAIVIGRAIADVYRMHTTVPVERQPDDFYKLVEAHAENIVACAMELFELQLTHPGLHGRMP